MIAFNEVHLSFDLALELLCLLPRGERKEDGATLSDLIHDRGFRKPAEWVIRFHILSKKYDLTKYSYQ